MRAVAATSKSVLALGLVLVTGSCAGREGSPGVEPALDEMLLEAAAAGDAERGSLAARARSAGRGA